MDPFRTILCFMNTDNEGKTRACLPDADRVIEERVRDGYQEQAYLSAGYDRLG